MADVIWTLAAFRVLETLPQATAFGIARHADYLTSHPQMGPRITRPRHLSNYRQLIHNRTYRIVYRHDETDDCFRIVNLQNCQQKFPTAMELDRALADEGEVPLD